MTKNVYRLKDYTNRESFYGVERIYLEGESLKEVFLQYILSRYDFNQEKFKLGIMEIEKLDIENRKRQKSKDMKNRTVLK